MKKPFQVNDRVRVYGGIPGTSINAMGSIATVVGKISESGYVDVRFDECFVDREIWGVHEKQCRRLIPKKRREIWINPKFLSCTDADPDEPIVSTCKGMECTIRFVEARKQ